MHSRFACVSRFIRTAVLHESIYCGPERAGRLRSSDYPRVRIESGAEAAFRGLRSPARVQPDRDPRQRQRAGMDRPCMRLLADLRSPFRFIVLRSARHRAAVRGASIPGEYVPASAVPPCERTGTQNKATHAPLSADGDERRLRYDRLRDQANEFRRVADETRPSLKKCPCHPRRENR